MPYLYGLAELDANQRIVCLLAKGFPDLPLQLQAHPFLLGKGVLQGRRQGESQLLCGLTDGLGKAYRDGGGMRHGCE